jgi:hypothetical protein
MTDAVHLFIGIAGLALGGVMVFAPTTAERLHKRYSFIRTAGPLRTLLGSVAILVGGISIALWLVRPL